MGCCSCEVIPEENKITDKNIELNPKEKNKIDKKKYKSVLKFADSQKGFINKALEQNNSLRKLHEVEPLVLDKDLYQRAFILAYQKLEEGNFSNNYQCDEKNEKLGMIIHESNEELDADKIIKIWYEDLINYNPKYPDIFDALNSTQMIWKGSEKFGIGYFSKDINNAGKKYWYVGLYSPQGNQPNVNKYKENVLNAEKNIKHIKNKINREKENRERRNKEEYEEYEKKNKLKITGVNFKKAINENTNENDTENYSENGVIRIQMNEIDSQNEKEISIKVLSKKEEREKLQEENKIIFYNKNKEDNDGDDNN